MAKLSIRLGKLEAQLRTLTGQMEEVQHSSGQKQKQLTDKISDIDGRMKRVQRDVGRITQTVKAMGSKQRSQRGRRASVRRSSRLAEAKKSPNSLYNYALDQLLKQKNYPLAQRALESFVQKYPDHENAGRSLYWLGESFYVRRDYQNAASAYLRGFNSYGTGPKAADSLLKLGMSLAALNEWDEACSTYDKLRANFPNPPQRILQRLNTEYERVRCNAGAFR